MRYTAKELMPKTGTPDRYGYYMAFYDGKWKQYPYYGSVSDKVWSIHITHFIDVPGEMCAPDELKPLAYPENKPSKLGWYIAFHEEYEPGDKSTILLESWDRNSWMGNKWAYADMRVKWFIPYRLDEPDELKEDDVSERISKDGTAVIIVNKNFINLQESDAVFFDSVDEFNKEVIHWLHLQGYDVTKREPEIKPCPNPECGATLLANPARFCKYGDDEDDYWVIECPECGFRYPLAKTLKEAIRLHNLIAKGE